MKKLILLAVLISMFGCSQKYIEKSQCLSVCDWLNTSLKEDPVLNDRLGNFLPLCREGCEENPSKNCRFMCHEVVSLFKPGPDLTQTMIDEALKKCIQYCP